MRREAKIKIIELLPLKVTLTLKVSPKGVNNEIEKMACNQYFFGLNIWNSPS